MAPVIRVDDEVWKWLQRHAKPLEDTPNSVLRRIAGLDGVNPLVPDETERTKNLKEKENSPMNATITSRKSDQYYFSNLKSALNQKNCTVTPWKSGSLRSRRVLQV